MNGISLRGYGARYLWTIGNNPTTELVIGSAWDWDQQIGIQYTPGTIAAGDGNLIIGQTNKNSSLYTHGNTSLYTNGIERFKINKEGNVGIGTTNPGAYKLAVEGTIGARKLKVTQGTWADDVFKKNYKLRPITEVEKYIQQHGHLPEVPSEKEVKGKDLDISETQTMLLKKIEELTLYVIELNNKLKIQEQKNTAQSKIINRLNKKY